ncbi:hypothetical protein [Streptomyces sp. NRRL S-87]|uniref:hypothetical protein n=1 Tax=Streptomyces sp. NRRL S-87 TaxID=1463920 RepID=UPI0004C22F2F|nr:hypothetical protein [Streptomyces sp. NRRL S-87]
MKYGELLIVDELHRLDRVASRLLQLMLDRFLTEDVSPRIPAHDDQSQAGRHQAAGRPGMPGSTGRAECKRTRAAQELHHLMGEPNLSGAQARRIAENWEVLENEENAELWWLVAAHLGDADAINYVQLLEEERAEDDEDPITVPPWVCEALKTGDLAVAQRMVTVGFDVEKLTALVMCSESERSSDESHVAPVLQPFEAFRARQARPVSPLREISRKLGAEQGSWVGGEGALLASGS